MSAQLVAVSVGRPREVEWQGEKVLTSIFKEQVAGRVRVGRLNIEGDEQSDLEVHGGEDKAVYAYPSEHYAFWREQLPGVALPWGVFGENLTVEGLLEDGVHVGDRFRIGTAEFVVTEPRMPCYKLALRLGRTDMVKRFMKSGRTGFYLAVLKEGETGAGDAIEPIGHGPQRVSIAAVVAAKSRKSMWGDQQTG
jgi:MOSC domain-containing protein YiiM